MNQVIISVNTLEEIKAGLTLLSRIQNGMLLAGGPLPTDVPNVANVGMEVDDLDLGGLGGEEEADDSDIESLTNDSSGEDLESLLSGSSEPTGPTVENMRDAFASAIKAKGKDATADIVGKIFAKFGVKNLSSIAEDKRQAFIDVLAKFSGKK